MVKNRLGHMEYQVLGEGKPFSLLDVLDKSTKCGEHIPVYSTANLRLTDPVHNLLVLRPDAPTYSRPISSRLFLLS